MVCIKSKLGWVYKWMCENLLNGNVDLCYGRFGSFKNGYCKRLFVRIGKKYWIWVLGVGLGVIGIMMLSINYYCLIFVVIKVVSKGIIVIKMSFSVMMCFIFVGILINFLGVLFFCWWVKKMVGMIERSFINIVSVIFRWKMVLVL